jgi:tetratricopeptide (TPR) repeat protein
MRCAAPNDVAALYQQWIEGAEVAGRFGTPFFEVGVNSTGPTHMNSTHMASRPAILVLLLFVLAAFLPLGKVHAEKLAVPPEAAAVIEKIYSFDLNAAINDSRRLQEQQPDHPLAYLLEAEARWWRIWCLAAEYKYGMTNAQHQPKRPGDERYLELSTRALSIAEAHLKQRETGEVQLYAGIAEASLARIYGLRGENRATARAGIQAREHFLHALQLDPDLADADFGLGLYNYYADTLSGFIKFLGFFMGIPGGNKHEGIRQLEHAMAEGVLTPAAARFYLALDLHKYDQQYEQASNLIEPLVEKYPSNPLFQLALGDLYGKLGRREQALASYRAAWAASVDDDCREHVRELVRLSMAAQGASESMQNR